jgi:hypothetical protein
VDNCCDTFNSVAARAGEQLHHGRIHPYFACDRNCSNRDQNLSGPKNIIAEGGINPLGEDPLKMGQAGTKYIGL